MSDLAAKDFHVASCQATLFTPEEAVSAVKLIKGLLPSWVSRFDQEPMVLPFGGEVPREIPRLILQSKDGARRDPDIGSAPSPTDAAEELGRPPWSGETSVGAEDVAIGPRSNVARDWLPALPFE